jgi:hypothetical protein
MHTKKQYSLFINYIIAWLPVIIFIITAGLIRFWQNSSSNYLLIGGDGPYYPIQVRNMIEHGKLALPDMPLLFMIEALIAKLLNAPTINECVLISVKLTDAILPPLAAIPVFLISKELYSKDVKSRLLSYLIVCFSIINLTTTHIFSSGLQKNAFAVVWMFLYVYLVIKFIRTEQKKYMWHSLFVLVLCVFTHFGSFSILLFFTLIIAIMWLLYNKKRIMYLNIKNAFIITLILVASVLLIWYFDPARLNRLLYIPIKLFEFPVYLLIMSGFDITDYLSPIHMIFTNFLTLIALIIFIWNRKKLEDTDKVIVFSFIIVAFILSSPLLGLEWANRLYVMSYIPVVITYLIIINRVKTTWVKVFPAFIFVCMILISILNVSANRGCITNEAYSEFQQIDNKLNFTSNSVMIGRQDLRLLAAWEFRIKAVADYLFTKEDFKKYDTVYVIRQIKGNNFSAGRSRGDAGIPAHSTKIYSGVYFELYKLNSSDDWDGGMGKPPKAKGTIVSMTDKLLILKNDKTGQKRTIELLPNTIFQKNMTPLEIGMQIEVLGIWKPFSLNVLAENIRPVENDK